MIPAVISDDLLSPILSEQLSCVVCDLKPVPLKRAHRMYSGQMIQPEGAVPIIVRFFHSFRGDEEARIEACALRDLYRMSFPVPELHLLVDSNKVAGAPFIVMQNVPGEQLGTVALADQDRIPYWLDQASALLLKLHSTRWQNAFDLLHPPLDPLDFADRQVKWWSRQAQHVGADVAADGFTWLRINLYQTKQASAVCPVHRDFHPDNILVQNDRITGVLDWGELTIADPAVDAAWSRMVLHTEVSPELGDTFIDAYRRRNPDVARTLHFWEMFAACKRLTTMTMLQHKTAERLTAAESLDALPHVNDRVFDAVVDFMRERLTEDD